MEHLAIMDTKTIDLILSGKKLIESRFSKNKIAPFHTINEGDIVYLKVSGGLVRATFIAGQIISFEKLNIKKVKEIKRLYKQEINADDNFWNNKQYSNYGTLIEIKAPQVIYPFSIRKLNRQAFISYDGNLKEYLIK